jgi:hypothetical protein
MDFPTDHQLQCAREMSEPHLRQSLRNAANGKLTEHAAAKLAENFIATLGIGRTTKNLEWHPNEG